MAPTVGYDGKFLWSGHSFGSRSGHGVHARCLLKEMIECCPSAMFKVYVLDQDTGLDPRQNCEFIKLPRYATNSILRNLIAYPAELMRSRIDVLLSFSTLPAYTPCRTILLLADLFWLANPGWLPRRIAVPRTFSIRNSVRRADVIITTTEFSRREIVRLLDVPFEKIAVVPHGIRDEFAAPVSSSDLSTAHGRYGIVRPYILSLNDIHPRKNLEGLVQAFEHFKARTGLPHRLVIAGRNLWPYPEFYRCVASSWFANDISVLGYIPSNDVLALYRGADLYVYPSFYEGWGLQVHEAMMAGTPVAVSVNTSMSEIAGNAADTFDPHNPDEMSRSMERILTDREFREMLVARGFEQIKRYSWRNSAEATLAICATLTSM
ncbi:MAG: glycosyltransferase family 4 protein [Alphaproteobacteria bacterium]